MKQKQFSRMPTKEYHANWRANHRESIRESARRWREKNRDYNKKWTKLHGHRKSIEKKYNFTQEQYDSLFAEQNGRCAICCQESTIKLSVDHDHISGRVRGLLCSACNVGLGFFRDDVSSLRNAYDYLLKQLT